MNEILNYWYEMEYFNPCWPVDVKSDIDLTKIKAPWPMIEQKQNMRTTFDVYIGKVKTEELIQWMINKLNLPAEEKIEKDNSLSCLCALKVDASGIYVPGSFAVSSFVWAVCELVENGFESDLVNQELEKLQESINKTLEGDEGVEPAFVSTELLNKIFENLCKKINIDINLILFTLWAKEKVQWGWKKHKESNEYVFPPIEASTELISSFYLCDIQKVKKSPTERIIKYICAMKSLQENERIQIDTNVPEMKKWTAPDKYPLGIWPSNYHPCLMQQISINLAISNEQDVFSVNGPPGTGKTTLLKEIIVANIIERSIIMSEFNEPDDAFTLENFTNPPDKYNSTYYVPDKKITPYGIVVASNNNAAVENISLDLPKKIKMDRSGRFSTNDSSTKNTDTYFSDIATNMLNEPAWGLISAKLGKKNNLKQVVQSLWWSENPKNLQDYYNEVRNIPDWKKAKEKFKAALKCVFDSRMEINEIRNRFFEYEKLQKNISKMKKIYSNSEQSLQMVVEELNGVKEEIVKLQSLRETKNKNIDMLLKEIPFIKRWLWWIFKSNPLISRWKLIESEVQDIIIEITTQYDLQQEKALLLADLQREKEKHKNKIEEMQLSYDKLSIEIEQYKSRFGNSITCDKFWENIEQNEIS